MDLTDHYKEMTSFRRVAHKRRRNVKTLHLDRPFRNAALRTLDLDESQPIQNFLVNGRVIRIGIHQGNVGRAIAVKHKNCVLFIRLIGDIILIGV